MKPSEYLENRIALLKAERDQLRAERDAARSDNHRQAVELGRLREERDEARAEVERLNDSRDMLASLTWAAVAASSNSEAAMAGLAGITPKPGSSIEPTEEAQP